MKTKPRYALAAALAALTVGPLAAQTVAPAPAKPADEETITLNPFEITATKDTGYQATETLAGTRIRTDLRDVGSAISVITKEFLQDIGATDNSTLLQYTTNGEVAGTHGTYAGLGNGTSIDETTNLRAPASAQRVRGLAAADNARDFFVTDIPWDSYNVERIDIQRGPNSILFGLGSPAGIVNASLRSAEFRNLGSVDARFGSYGSRRGSLDINQQLIPGTLAIRLDGLWNNEKYRQDPAFQNDHRLSGALRFDPKLFTGSGAHTSIRVKYENGDIKANRSRNGTPNDSVTPWFRGIDPTNMFGGMGKVTVNNGYDVGSAPQNFSPWLGGYGDQQQPVWLIDGQTNQLIRVNAGYINPGARNSDGTIRGSAQGVVGRRFSGTFFGLNSLPQYANNAKLVNAQYGQYRNMSLLDPTVYDFYNNLIDGPTKSEYERWNAYNIDISQTALNDRLGVQFTYDKQKYKRGGQSLLGGSPTLNLDILRNYQDLTANPNFGRPYVAGGGGSGSGNSYQSDRKYVRGSIFGELRASDFTKNDFLVKLLGKHRFNGVYADETYATENRSFQLYGNSREWAGYWNGTDGSTSSLAGDRPPLGMIFLGSSVANASSASGLNIPNIKANVTLQDANVYAFDSNWNNPSVAYNAPWTIPANLAVAYDPATATTQASNPANYVGWNSNFKMNLVRYNDGADLSLLTKAQKSYRVTKSNAGSWQGFLWKDAIVPTLGWRYDEVKSRGVTAAANNSNRAILNLAPDVYKLPDIYPDNQILKDHSTSGGLVVHLNRLFTGDRLPINVSVSYNKSNNFQVTDLRRDLYGNPISNPSGKTKDYGVLLSTKDGKFSFRAMKYETSIKNGSTELNSSGVGGTVQQGLRFRNVFLYKLSNYPWDSREQPQDRNDWQVAYVDSTGRPVASGTSTTPPAGATLQSAAQAAAMRDASIKAWNDIQKTLAGKGYFTAWGYQPTTAAALTDRATYEAAKTSPDALNPPAAFQPDPASVIPYSAVTPQGFAVTADTVSKGYEFELTANPLPNLRLAFNAAQTEAIRSNVGGKLLDDFVSYMDQQMAGPAGDMRQFSGGYASGNEVRANWAGWRGSYTLMKLQEGAMAPEIRKWRYNVVANYSFKQGFMKGVGLGGSYRWQDKVVIGYPVIPQTATLGSFDLTKPYYGPTEDAIDLWASYEHKLSDKIGWKIQLNVRNAFAKDNLIPISVEPDGKTWASVRIAPTQEWFVTNTFSF